MTPFDSKETTELLTHAFQSDINSDPSTVSLIIPGYNIVKPVGKGATGIVYKGIEKKSGRTVAIKVLSPESRKEKEALYRFHRELHVVSRLSHPYIIKIFGVGKDEKPYIIMEYLKNSLKNVLYDQKVKLKKIDVLKTVRKLAKALEYAHRCGVIHRDIKPANILFRANGHPVLADFGLVRAIHSKSDFTKPFSILGTPHYMSPELCRAEKSDHLSDIYSLGVVLFEMLSGKLPYNGKNFPDLFKQHLDPSIPLLPPEVKKYQPLIDGMMAKDKKNRFNATQARIMLEKYIRDSAYDKNDSAPDPKRKLLFLLLSGAVIIFIILVILIFYYI